MAASTSVAALFRAGTNSAFLQDVTVPVIVTEGAFKTLALHRLAHHDSERPRFVPIGLIGVNNYLASIGKATGPTGTPVNVKGFVPELEQMKWNGRRAYVAYDSDLVQKPGVESVRRDLAVLLQQRGAEVGFLEWKSEQAKGIDDLLVAIGPDEVLRLIDAVDFRTLWWRAELILNDKGKTKALLANAATALRRAPQWHNVLVECVKRIEHYSETVFRDRISETVWS